VADECESLGTADQQPAGFKAARAAAHVEHRATKLARQSAATAWRLPFSSLKTKEDA
jgi:hypothetical protein